MTNLRTIYNAITGEITTVELTQAELADRANAVAEAKAHADALAAKQVARAALLTKLGITEQEAQLLLGS